MLSYVDAEIVQPLEKAQITNSTMASDKKKKKIVCTNLSKSMHCGSNTFYSSTYCLNGSKSKIESESESEGVIESESESKI